MTKENENVNSENDNEENTNSEETSNEETSNSEENVNSEENESSENDNGSEETVESLTKENEQLTKTNKQVFARAKKAEGFVEVDGKWVKQDKSVNKPKGVSVLDEMQRIMLQEKGLDEEDIDLLVSLKELSEKKGDMINLIQAQKDPLFVIHREKKEAEATSKAAQLKAAGGGSEETEKKKMTREEHMEFAKKKAQKL